MGISKRRERLIKKLQVELKFCESPIKRYYLIRLLKKKIRKSQRELQETQRKLRPSVLRRKV